MFRKIAFYFVHLYFDYLTCIYFLAIVSSTMTPCTDALNMGPIFINLGRAPWFFVVCIVVCTNVISFPIICEWKNTFLPF